MPCSAPVSRAEAILKNPVANEVLDRVRGDEDFAFRHTDLRSGRKRNRCEIAASKESPVALRRCPDLGGESRTMRCSASAHVRNGPWPAPGGLSPTR